MKRLYKVDEVMKKPYLRHLLVFHDVILPCFKNMDSNLGDFGLKVIHNLEKNFKRLNQQSPYKDVRRIYKLLPISLSVKARASNMCSLSFVDDIFLRNDMNELYKVAFNGEAFYSCYATQIYDYWLNFLSEVARPTQIQFVEEEIVIPQDMEFAEYMAKSNLSIGSSLQSEWIEESLTMSQLFRI